MMVAFIITFGLVIFLMGAVVSLEPTRFFTKLNNLKTELFVYVAAVAVRLVLGILLVFNASQSGFPLTIKFIGWLSIIAAVVLSVIGHGQFIRLMSWVLKCLEPYAHFAGYLAIVFGGFLLIAFV